MVIDAYDASALFEKGGKDLRAGRCERAVETYDLLIEGFPDSPLVPLALYNRGLCLDELERHEEAAAS
jgi:TolA-binding protein